MIVQVAPTDYLSFSKVQSGGWWNLLWLLIVLFFFVAWKGKKVGVTGIGKNEWGMLEILGFPLIPVPFGIWLYVKGLIHVKQVSTAPTRIELLSRREIDGRVLLVSISILVVVGVKGGGFRQRRRDLIAALYNALDENVDDAENPERITQTRDILEAATREILKTAKSADMVTRDAVHEVAGEFLQKQLGEYIVEVLIREDAPVDGQLWKEGRSPNEGSVNELPPGASPDLRAVNGGSA